MPKLPGVNHLDAVRALQKAGFRIARQGKHIMSSENCSDEITVQPRAEHARPADARKDARG